MQQRLLTPDEFRRMQLLELDMLCEIDRVCRKHNIKYALYGGSLLGAIRHKGYIPWDDDADIAMLREEYEKFKEVAHEMDPSICYFQDNTNDQHYRWGYGKVRRTGTKYIRVGQEHLKCKTGVFVDIFPFDDIPMCTLGQMIQDFHCYFLRKTTWSEVGRVHTRGLKKLWFTLLSKIPIRWVFNQLNFYHKRSKNHTPNKVRCLLFTAPGKLYYKSESIKDRYGIPKEWLLNLEEYDFEGKKLFGIKEYDAFLKFTYRNYMQLPPIEKRIQHSPVSDLQLI